VGGAELLARVHPPAAPPQPVAVDQAGASELSAEARAAEPLDRLAVSGSGSGRDRQFVARLGQRALERHHAYRQCTTGVRLEPEDDLALVFVEDPEQRGAAPELRHAASGTPVAGDDD
jgi:hypothetical protein